MSKTRTPCADILKFTDEFVIGESNVQFIRKATNPHGIVYQKNYILNPITPEELLSERLSGKPGLVFKYGTFLYYCAIPSKLKFFACSNIGTHLCADCGHMSALPDSKGGCKKVRDKSLNFQDFRSYYNKKQNVTGSKRIEKYEFIEQGYESFNTSQDSLLVIQCKNRADIIPHTTTSTQEVSTKNERLETSI